MGLLIEAPQPNHPNTEAPRCSTTRKLHDHSTGQWNCVSELNEEHTDCELNITRLPECKWFSKLGT